MDCIISSDSPYQFTGQRNDGTGLDYYRARYYNPTWGRFIAEDPLGFGAGDVNIYRYVLSNPVNFSDPMGLDVEICCRPAQIAGGLIDHCWVRTATKCAGMGVNPDIPPGQQYEGYGMPTYIIDHCKDTPTKCTKQNNVDEQCVNNKLNIGAPAGPFVPPINQCQAFAYGVVNACRTGPQMTPAPWNKQ